MRLEDHPHPLVAVDVALLTVLDAGEPASRLAVLVHRRPEGWALPGRFVRLDERLEDAALIALREKVGVTGEQPQQLRVLDALDRDPRYRVLSVAHADLVPEHRLPDLPDDVVLAPLQDDRACLPHGRALVFDHDAVLAEALAWARDRYDAEPDPDHLLGPEFTLSALQRVHEAVAGRPLPVDAFRRRFLHALSPTGTSTSGARGRPARLYRRAASGALELDARLSRLNASPSVARLVRDVCAAREVQVRQRPSYLSLAREGRQVSVYVHPTRISLALTPGDAEAAARAHPGTVLQPRSGQTWYVVVPDAVLQADHDAALRLALEAVDRWG